jgi:DNA-binding CsgD family transcriptional regulator
MAGMVGWDAVAPAMVGRDAELAAIVGSVGGLAAGTGGATFVVGEPGIGKTRLVNEVMRRATERGICVLRGRATATAVQFRPLSEALLAVLRRGGPPADDELVPYRPALSRLLPEWRLARPPGPDDSLVVLAEAVLRLLVRLGRPYGCVLVLEDLHDADEDTLAVVDYLVDNVAGEPILVIGTVRGEPGEAMNLVRAARQRRVVSVLELAPLDPDTVRVLAAGCLGVAPEHVPPAVLARLVRDGDGIPFYIEELLTEMVSDGSLVRTGPSWTQVDPVTPGVPVTVAASLAARADRLGPAVSTLLQAAALLGRRFSAALAGAVVGLPEPEVMACLRTAVSAQLVSPDGDADTYSFRHALTAEALRNGLLPAERAALSRRAAQTIEGLAVAPPDDDLVLRADLWATAGQPRRAAELFVEAGRQATVQGAGSTAIRLLDRGLSLLPPGLDDPLAAEASQALLDALVAGGQIERAYALGHRFDQEADQGRRAAVHLRLARAAAAAGQWDDGLREVSTVRRLVGSESPAELTAALDAVAANLTFGKPAGDRVARAESLARNALAVAEEHRLAEPACEALEVLGRCARLHSLATADELYHQALRIADDNGLTMWRIRLLFDLGAHDGIRDADPRRLTSAYVAALRAGAVVTAIDIDNELAIVHLARGEYDLAERSANRSAETSIRLRLADSHVIALGVRVCVAAHRGNVEQAEALLAEYRRHGGERSDFTAAVWGYGLALGALRDGDNERAFELLALAVKEEADRLTHYLSFTHGPHLSLAVLAGRAGWPEVHALADSGRGQARWNRQFVALSRAVLCGRDGDRLAAATAFAEFSVISAPYPLARHVGLRLVAAAGLADGWGDPVTWLRAAEAYFHEVDAQSGAAACRALLRRAGASVLQRRQGSEDIPADLRQLGVTVREYEVLRHVVQGRSNQEIGRRLYLSARTVEKHVAHLLVKMGQPDRVRLAECAGHLAPAVGPNVGIDSSEYG